MPVAAATSEDANTSFLSSRHGSEACERSSPMRHEGGRPRHSDRSPGRFRWAPQLWPAREATASVRLSLGGKSRIEAEK